MTSASSSNLWVVIAAYNEASVIAGVVRDVRQLYTHVVVVDDGSSDDSWQKALESGATVLRHPVNLGQGAALQTGISYALSQGAQYVASFDADGQHDPRDLGRLLEALRDSKADVALGSRFLGKTVGMAWERRLLLKTAVRFTRLTTGLKLTDSHNGLRLFTADAAQKFQLRQNRMAHASEILQIIANLKLRFIEVPSTVIYTAYSKQKGQSFTESINILFQLFIFRFIK